MRKSFSEKRDLNRTDIMDVSSHHCNACGDEYALTVFQNNQHPWLFSRARVLREASLRSRLSQQCSSWKPHCYHQRSKIAASSGRHRRPVDDIRPRASQLHVGLESVRPVSLGRGARGGFACLRTSL